MDWMPGCSLFQRCNSTNVQASVQSNNQQHAFCHPMSLLADICVDDGMDRMAGCEAYLTHCNSTSSSDKHDGATHLHHHHNHHGMGSMRKDDEPASDRAGDRKEMVRFPMTGNAVPEDCTLHPSMPSLPTTRDSVKAVKSICQSHYMEDCQMCPEGNIYIVLFHRIFIIFHIFIEFFFHTFIIIFHTFIEFFFHTFIIIFPCNHCILFSHIYNYLPLQSLYSFFIHL
jgi:hypothetical protein